MNENMYYYRSEFMINNSTKEKTLQSSPVNTSTHPVPSCQDESRKDLNEVHSSSWALQCRDDVAKSRSYYADYQTQTYQV